MPGIIETELREFWRQDTPAHEIAELFGVHKSSVYKAARRLNLRERNLPNPGRSGRRIRKAVGAVAKQGTSETELDRLLGRLARARENGRIATPPGWTLERDMDVRMTAGRYSQLRELSESWNMEFSRVLGRWHAVRVV